MFKFKIGFHSKFLMLCAVVVMSFTFSVLTVFANTVNVSGTLSTTDTDIRNAYASFGCGVLSFGNPLYADTYSFTVSAAGSYTFTVTDLTGYTGTDIAISIYSTPFDINNPGPSCLNVNVGPAGTSVSANLQANTNYVFMIRSSGFGGENGPYGFSASGPGDIVIAGASLTSASGDPLPVFTDGRINNYDAAAPVAVYAIYSEAGIAIHIYSPEGVLLLVVDPSVIAGAPDNPASPVTLGEANGVAMYRIPGESGGLWQVNAPQYNGKTYVLIFSELFPDGGYTSFELD